MGNKEQIKTMFRKSALLICGLFVISQTQSQTLIEDFNGASLNTSKWSSFYPNFGNSDLVQSGGVMTFKNGAFLNSVDQFNNPTITGKFSFTGWSYDRLKIIFRSNGSSIDSNWQTPIGGIGIQFTPSSNPDYGASKTIQFWDFNSATQLAYTGFTINMNTQYDFKIVDSGNLVSVYLNNSVTPTLTYSSTLSFGNYVQIGNREQAAGFGPPPYYVQLDSVSISSVPEPSALSLLAIGLGGLAMLRRRRL